MTKENILLIEDWTLEGRQSYIDKNRIEVELSIEHAAEELSDSDISRIFGSMDEVVPEVIKRFLVPNLDPDKVPCRDLNLFSQLKFWAKHKTCGQSSLSGIDSIRISDEILTIDGELGSVFDRISKTLKCFNEMVDADLVGYWLIANKKLCAELSDGYTISIEREHSPTQKTRYKSDASFRFLYLYLDLGNRVSLREHCCRLDYEYKYLRKNKNQPQYVAPQYPESHTLKHGIRQFIAKVIYELVLEKDNFERIDLALSRPFAKKALLDQYEFDQNMKEAYWPKLKQLKVLGGNYDD